MKRILDIMLLVLGLAFLAFIFSGCEKDSDLFLLEEQEIELRGQNTKVVTGPTVKVTVPKDPPPEAVKEKVQNALGEAANGESGKMKDALENAKENYKDSEAQGDSEFLAGEECNEQGVCAEVVGVTFTTFYVYYDEHGKLVIIVISIQILEEPVDEKTKEHEDGHSYIGKEVAKKVAEKAAKEAKKKDPPLTPEEVAQEVISEIQKVEKKAQEDYEDATDSGRKGDQAKEAKKAAHNAIQEYLHPKKSK